MKRDRWGVPAVLWAAWLLVLPAAPADAQVFRRGDLDGASGLGVTDAVRILRFLFVDPDVAPGSQAVAQCPDAADLDDDGDVAINDAIYLLNFLFSRGREPAAPFPFCGLDRTPDDLQCLPPYPTEAICCGDPMFCPGDAFFFVIDRSGSLQDTGGLQLAKREVSRTISEFSVGTRFGVIFFDSALTKFPSDGQPAFATPTWKTAALAWIASTPGGSGSCPAQALQEALAFADNADEERMVITYYGDGGGTCRGANERQYLEQMAQAITEQNVRRVQINCVGIDMAGRTFQRQILRQLAAANNGTYREIN